MFETDAAILASDGKYSLPTWKKVGVCFILIICFVSLYVTLSKLDSEKILITQSIDDLGTTETFTIESRIKWDPNPPKHQALAIQPASYVVISHTGTRTCSNLTECRNQMLLKKTYQISKRQFSDIGYNFLIGNNQTYEGRGFDTQPQDFYNYKNNSFSIALIGNFSKTNPVDSQLQNLQKLIRYGIEKGKIHTNYTLLGHKQFRTTDSPGRKLYDIINQWDHWKNI